MMAAYYHLLFPARQAQLDFLAKLAGAPPAALVDVASGTGEYTAALCEIGYGCVGIELDPAMHLRAIKRHGQTLPPRFVQGDMLELTELVRGPLALAFCIGNSLPLLKDDAQVREAINQMWDLTNPVGAVALQVVNFDRALAELTSGGFVMPDLSAEFPGGGTVRLERSYTLQNSPEHVVFRTCLSTPEGMMESTTPLLAQTRERLSALLPRGASVEWSGDFAGAPWSERAPATVLTLRRPALH